MSHKVTLSYLRNNSALENAQTLLKRFEQTIKKIKHPHFLKIFQTKANELEALINSYHTYTGAEQNYQFERQIAHLDNQYNSLQSTSNIMIKMLDQQPDLIDEVIESHGAISAFAIEFLMNENVEINKTSLESKIKSISSKQIGAAEIKKAKTIINESNVDQLVKDHWIKKLSTMNFKSYADLPAIMSDQERINRELDQAYEDFKAMFIDLGFNFVGHKKAIKEGQIVYQMILKNNVDNRVAIEFNAKRQIQYQLGNYTGHLCEQTTKEFFQMIKDRGEYQIVHYNIIRDDDDEDNGTLKELEYDKIAINE